MALWGKGGKTAAGNHAKNLDDMQRRIDDAKALGIQASSFRDIGTRERDDMMSLSAKANDMDLGVMRNENRVHDEWMGKNDTSLSLTDDGSIEVGENDLTSFKSSFKAAKEAEEKTFIQMEQEEPEITHTYNDSWGLAD
ncbi:MAG: hypothetical protein CFH43_00646 [Proteobacteria bacterium]|nr:MAG: hypothetical protein CFH43_00646 [Pseudomonadota bacterium]